MRLRHLTIRNYRGIRELDWTLPDRSLVCLIGRGDSTKSTILEAIRCLFYPQWNLSFVDSDFFLGNTDSSINIEGIVGNLPDTFRDLAKFGYYLCGWDGRNFSRAPEPGEELEDALCVRLSVSNDLEPIWQVIKVEENDGVAFRQADRAKIGARLLGPVSDRDLTWSRGSILNQITNVENVSSSLADASRTARQILEGRRGDNLTEFDGVARDVEETARFLGVPVVNSYKSQLDAHALDVRYTGLALHDGNVPLRLLGSGSKRVLIAGLRTQAMPTSHLTLFDEIETGLEPHRIARLLQHLGNDQGGQYILTTHSPVVLRELTVGELHVVHCDKGLISVVAVNKSGLEDFIQGKIRKSAEAFLAPKIIVCEGATEVGFLRGLDDHWTTSKKMNPFAYCGVGLLDAGGAAKIKSTSMSLRSLGYSVAVLADSDAPSSFSDEDADELRNNGVMVVKWQDCASLEERVFLDLPWQGVTSSIEVACEFLGDSSSIRNTVETQYCSKLESNVKDWVENEQLRRSIGRAAKTKNWFKRQDKSRDWAKVVTECIEDETIRTSDLVQQLNELRNWIDSV